MWGEKVVADHHFLVVTYQMLVTFRNEAVACCSSLLTFFELKRPGAFVWGEKAVAGCISRLCQIDPF